jgi:hypothetical protein
MFSIPGRISRLCDGSLTRRELLQVGGCGLLGLSLPGFLARQAEAATSAPLSLGRGWGKAKSVIFVFLQGGPPHLDLWDPKPDTPDNIRSPFKLIHSKVPGMDFCETLPRLAGCADKYTLLRSVSYSPNGLLNHTAAHYQMLTGYTPDKVSPTGQLEPPSPNDYPNVGSNVIRLKPPEQPMLPFVMLPRPLQESNVIGKAGTAGFLGRAYNEYYDKAFRFILSGRAKRAFDLNREPIAVRERYGRHTFGQSLLLARRLIEAGTRFVQVNWPAVANGDPMTEAWDCHYEILKPVRDLHAPKLDSALSSLVQDLDERGMLKDTLVLAIGEFGRSPRKGVSTSGNINKPEGRDHWPYCYTALICGGGIASGRVFGKSDVHGSAPVDSPVNPIELLATIYHALGIDPATEVRNHLNQPRPLVDAKPVLGLFA